MESEQNQTIVALDPQPQRRCCSVCGLEGHNSQTFPLRTQQDTMTTDATSSARNHPEDNDNDHQSLSKQWKTSAIPILRAQGKQ